MKKLNLMHAAVFVVSLLIFCLIPYYAGNGSYYEQADAVGSIKASTVTGSAVTISSEYTVND